MITKQYFEGDTLGYDNVLFCPLILAAIYFSSQLLLWCSKVDAEFFIPSPLHLHVFTYSAVYVYIPTVYTVYALGCHAL